MLKFQLLESTEITNLVHTKTIKFYKLFLIVLCVCLPFQLLLFLS